MFTYNTEWIKTVAQCSLLIQNANAEKALLEAKIINNDRRLKIQTDRNTDYNEVQNRIATLTPLVDTFPDQKIKDKIEKDLILLDYREKVLSDQVEGHTEIELLDDQHDIRCATLVRDEKIAYIAALEARKAQLEAA
jgi:hypothetical protein